ncbi:MAG TPA: hypothetical protein VGU20_01180 [Stellaceae bacterium]|nr:hypothetical protein [Stellaceae bacterium]
MTPQPDTARAVEFLGRYFGRETVVLTAIVPDGATITRCFDPADRKAIAAFVDRYQGKRNIYFSVNPVRDAIEKKATKLDIAALAWLHVDIDPRDGYDLQAERARILEQIQRFSPTPTVVIDSGGGFQAFWKLRDPVTIAPLAAGTSVDAVVGPLEAHNRRLEMIFGGDHCHNIDRIMRVPGTINLPTKKKRKKGREATLAQLIHFNETAYDIEVFGRAAVGGTGRLLQASGISFDDVEIPPRFYTMLDGDAQLRARWQGDTTGLNDVSRSGMDMSMVGLLSRRGFNQSEIVAILRAYPHGKAASEDDRYLERMLALVQKNASAAPYLSVDGALHYEKVGKDGETVLVRLCNFTAGISEDIFRDDGADMHRSFVVEGQLSSGRRLARTAIAADEFFEMKWVAREWGAAAIVTPGPSVRGHLAVAIQMQCQPVPTRTVFAHTGWRETEHGLVYLHGNGAISTSGPVAGIEVNLPGALGDYVLPATDEDVLPAIRASIALTELGDIGYALMGAAYRAPLAHFLPVTVSLYVAGPTGVFKSAVTALAQAHFGSNFSFDHLPGNWSSTANALEREAFVVKDALFTIDDFAPRGAPHEVQRLHATAERVLRAQGNRSGRHRMNADSTLRPVLSPRGLMVASGEDVPTGQSLRARMFIVELDSGAIDQTILTKLQGYAAGGLLSQSMSNYLRWIATESADLEAKLQTRHLHLRNGIGGAHARMPGNIASLLLGVDQFLSFAVELGAITAAAAEKHRSGARRAFEAQAARQAALQASEDPVDQFVALIRNALVSGKGHLVDRASGGMPGKAGLCGWREAEGERSTRWQPSGERLGWIDGDAVYLSPEGAFRMAQRLAREGGDGVALTKNTLFKRLDERGLLSQRDADRHTKSIIVDGRKQRALVLTVATVLGVEGAETTPF